jgi:hypothetical protein
MTGFFLRAGILTALLWGAPSWAQVVYKSIMPDGRVIYSERPAPGAKKVEEIVPQTGNTGVRTTTPQEQQQVQQLDARRKQDADRQDQIAQAEQALQEAEAALAGGTEPLPGERHGTAGGGSRLSEAYFARQQALQAAVDAAHKRLEEVRAAGN